MFECRTLAKRPRGRSRGAVMSGMTVKLPWAPDVHGVHDPLGNALAVELLALLEEEEVLQPQRPVRPR